MRKRVSKRAVWGWRKRSKRYQYGRKSLYKVINDDSSIVYYSYDTSIAKILNGSLFMRAGRCSPTTSKHKNIIKGVEVYATLHEITPTHGGYEYMANLDEREIMNAAIQGAGNG